MTTRILSTAGFIFICKMFYEMGRRSRLKNYITKEEYEKDMMILKIAIQRR